MAKKDKSPHPNGPSQPPRTGLPPIGRAPENAHKTNDDASQASDFSSITGFPRTTRTTFGARSVFTAKTTASRWKNNDVVLLPKDNLKSDASVAVAAAASLLVNGNEPANFEENAVQSVANMISSTEKINEDALIVVKPSQANKKFNDPMDDSVVPISFNKVKENLGGLMEEKEKEKERNKKSGNEDHNNDSDESKARITASEFYARCALLAASAIMKADPDDKAAIAQTAAETILSFHNSEMQANEDWLDSADENLREVADEVSNSIRVLSVPNSQAMASVASVAVVSEGGKALALERHRRRMEKASKLEVVEVIDMHNDDKEKINSDDDEEDVINPIRNKGSLMDNMSDGDDDDDNEKTFTPVPSRGRGMSLSQHTQAQKSENSSNQKAHVQNAVRNLLESTSDDVPVETEVVDPSPRVRRSSQLDRKQQEITKRIQRIQMRAAGRTDEEIDAVLGNKKELSNPNMLPNAGPPPLGNKSRSRKNRMDDRSVFEDKDDLMDGINSVFTPVVSYLGKMAKTNLPSMPKCEGEEDDFGFDEYEDSRPHGMKNRNLVAAQNHDHGSNPNFNGTDIDVEQKLISPTSTLSADLGEFKFRDSQARETSKVPNQDQGAQSEQVPMGRVSTNDTGAFSAALNNGDFSSIPVQKLSTIPPVDDSLETTKNLFFSSAQEQGATDSYVNKEEKKEDTMSSTINVARGQSDVNGLLNELGESEKKSKKKGKKSRTKKMKKMFALGKKR